MKKILLFLCTILCANVLMAQTYFTIGGDLTYYITSSSSNEVEVDDCDETATAVIIPASVEYNGTTYSVTSIGAAAFYNCSSLTSITIPNSVTSIGSGAFSGCSNLTSITIPNSVTSIENSAFRGCSSLASIDIPNGVTSIGNSAFSGCSSLSSIDIPMELLLIGNSAFSGCSSLTSIDIPNGVTSIGNSAFSGCSNLTSIDIPNGVTSIGNSAFQQCSSLISIDIPNNVTAIGQQAFDRCSSLTSVTIPNSVTSIGQQAFSGCSSLTSISIPNGVTSIGIHAFSGCSSLTSIDIPNGVTSIGAAAFFYCSSLTSIDIPNSVTSIGERAFINCSSLTSVTIPNSVTSIGGYTFQSCSSLTSVDIPNSVISIGEWAFSRCSSLSSVNIGNSVTSIGEWAFNLCYDLTSVTCLAETAPSLGSYVFNSTPSTKTLTVPCESDYSAWESATTWASVERIGCEEEECVDVFTIGDLTYEKTSATEVRVKDCSETATEVIIPASVEQCGITYNVTSIGDWAFYNCFDLTSVNIPNSVTSIGGWAFYNCSSLTSITIPNTVTSIGAGAFSGCSNLTSIDIPNSVTSIGMWAFYNCSSLTSVTCLAENAPSLGSAVFSYTPSTITLTVPFGSNYSSWEEASTWQKVYYLIQEGEEKELASDFTITEVRKIKNEGVLRIKPTGQLINSTSENVSGVFEIETPTLPDDKWSFVGAPFNGYKLEAIKEGTRDVAVSVFDYDSADWSEEFATIETPIRKGEGFLLWSFAEEATVFTTNPENPSEEYTLNNGGVSVAETLTTHEGGGNWMALANPYTFKLDIAKFLQDQSDVKGGIVYRLNGVSWEEVSEGVIGLTEGFFVNYDNPGSQTATFVKSHRYTGTSSKAEKKKEYIKLYMNDGERTSKISIAQNEEASQGDDIFDANKLFSPFEIAEPYFLTEGVALVKEEVKTLPYTATLNVKSYESKEVTFSVGDIPEDYNVYLIDNGFDIKMNDGVEYNTRIVAGENADRFKFVIKKAHRLTETVNKDIYVNNFNREVRISSTQKDLKIEVYDALGRKVFETKDYKFELNQVPAGAYMVKVYNRFARKDAKIVLH